MGRLKRDHSGYKTIGIWLKYQEPKINERVNKGRSKKDTNRWCRGKIGREHTWHRYQEKHWNDSRWKLLNTYTSIKCIECGKQKYTKTAKTKIYPFHLFIEDKSEGYFPIQVRVNGKILKRDYSEYQQGKYWCNNCGYYH